MQEILSNLSLETILISISLPIILFGIQLYLWYRDKKTTQITFVENKCVGLSPFFINEIEGLETKYKDKPISGNLLFYQLTICNSGVSDIPQSQIYSPLCIETPKDFQWKSFKIVDKSEEFNANIEVLDDKLFINWELFKKGEFLRIDTIIEHSNEAKENLKDTDNLLPNISFNKSRIVNLKVQKTNIRKYDIFLRNLKTTMFLTLLIPTFIISMLNNTEARIVFELDSKEFCNPVEFRKTDESKIVLVDNNNIEFEYIPKTENTVKDVYVLKKKREKPWGLDILWIITNIWGFILFEQLRMRKKRERMRLVSKKPWNQFEIEDC